MAENKGYKKELYKATSKTSNNSSQNQTHGSLKDKSPEKRLLADIKVCDEGEYKFRKSYEAGADIATVMGMSSLVTIRACKKIAYEFGKEYMMIY